MAQAKRRLAAILAADVAGYSRLMSDDERATIDTLNAYRSVFREHIGNHDGRVVDTAGDSVLSVFDSVVEAVQCAIDVQSELEKRNADLAEDRRMRFRIGVNLGDIIGQDDGTIYGDGVNIAARLEEASEPGSVTISGTAYDQVHNRIDTGCQDLGTLEVKNIREPVRAYRLATGDAMPAIETKPAPQLPDKPSIAVLPFDNLSGDPEQEYFADGIAEDLITALSRIRWLFVTARNSTFTYKGEAVDVKQVGRDLGVRYVVEGSVRKGGERVRITAQLVDAATGNQIWAERYDRDLSDVFALQDEITETLVAALQGEVGEFERERAHRKPPNNLDAWEAYQRGLWHMWQINAEGLAEARRLFQRASDLDPNFAQAFAASGYTRFIQVTHSYVDSPPETLERALRLANRAVTLDDKEAMAHFALGRIQTLRGQYDAAIPELRAAIDLNPSMALAHYGLAFALWLTEQLDEAVSQCDTAIRLSPRDPVAWAYYALRAWTHFLLGDYEAVLEDARHSIRHPAATYWAHTTLAPALALLDRPEEARIALDNLLEVQPDFSPDTAMAAWSPLNPEALRPRFKTWIDGLRKAGLDIPHQPTIAD